MELDSGVTATLVASFEASNVFAAIEVHGTEGVLSLPDPNTFGGPVRIRRGREDWEDVPFATRGPRDVRGIGLHDMVESIAVGRPHRASGELGAHVVEVACSILRSAEEGRAVAIASSVEQPPPLPVEAAT